MKNFLYKLIFPNANKLYVGRASDKNRYGRNNKPGEEFVGPHHNVEVQKLLDSGEFCFFYVVKEFETEREVELAEDAYLKKVWKSDDWVSRPSWLMNRNRSSIGGGGLLHLTPEQVQSFQEAGTAAKGGRNNKGRKRPDVSERMLGNTYGSKTKGVRRPDVSESMLGNNYGSKHRGRKNPWNAEMNSTPVTCPHCGKTIGNKAALGLHIKRKH